MPVLPVQPPSVGTIPQTVSVPTALGTPALPESPLPLPCAIKAPPIRLPNYLMLPIKIPPIPAIPTLPPLPFAALGFDCALYLVTGLGTPPPTLFDNLPAGGGRVSNVIPDPEEPTPQGSNLTL